MSDIFEVKTRQTCDLSILFSLYSIDSFLNSFQLSNQEKLSLLDNLQISFKKEFEIEKEKKRK
jgi:hypothetical protein